MTVANIIGTSIQINKQINERLVDTVSPQVLKLGYKTIINEKLTYDTLIKLQTASIV